MHGSRNPTNIPFEHHVAVQAQQPRLFLVSWTSFGVIQYGVTKGIMGVKEDYVVRKGFHQYI